MYSTMVSLKNGIWDIVWDRKAGTGVAGAGSRQAGIYGAVFTLETDGVVLSSKEAEVKELGEGGAFSEELGQGQRKLFHLAWPGKAVKAELVFKIYQDRSYLTVQTALTNTGAASVELKNLFFPCINRQGQNRSDSSPDLEIGGDDASAKVFVESGNCAWSGVLDIDAESAFNIKNIPEEQRWREDERAKVAEEGVRLHLSYGIGVVFNPRAKLACTIGALTFERVSPRIITKYRLEEGIVFFGAFSSFAGFGLRAGETIRTETFLIDFREDPLAALEEYGSAVRVVNKIEIKRNASIGWVDIYAYGFPLFVFYDPAGCEKRLLANLAVINRRLRSYGVEYFWVSQMNLKDGMPDFPEERNKYYPRGFKWLSAKLARSGARLGLWSPPFLIAESNAQLKEPGVAARDKRCGAYLAEFRPPFHPENKFRPKDEITVVRTMDYTHPKAGEIIRKRFRAMAAMGAKYHMIDFMPMSEECDYHDKNVVPGLEAYRVGLRAVRAAVGPGVYLLSASAPTLPGIGIQTAARVGLDYGEFMLKQCADWELHQNVASNMSACFYTHRNFFINDSMDVLLVGLPCPLATARFSVGMLALSGGPVMLGDDLTIIPAERLALLEKCLPPYGRIAKALDLFQNTKPKGYPSILHLHVEGGWDNWEVVGLVNYGLAPENRKVRLADIGLGKAAQVNVFDFWEEKSLGEFTGEVEVMVERRSMKILRINKSDKGHPWILSSNMHVVQGAEELKDVKWDSARRELSGVASRTKGAKGKVFVSVPRGRKIKKIAGKGVALGGVKNGVAVVELNFDRKELVWRIQF